MNNIIIYMKFDIKEVNFNNEYLEVSPEFGTLIEQREQFIK